MDRTKKWFTKDGKVTSSTAPVDHVRFVAQGWTEHTSKSDAEKAAAPAADDKPAEADKPTEGDKPAARGRAVKEAPQA